MKAEEARRQITDLLTQWCDALVRLQADLPGCARLDGGILCPACGRIHGRCWEAVYPLMTLAHANGDPRYLTAAKKLFAWGQNLRCADGGSRNEVSSEWKGVTAFAAIALCDALALHGDLLAPEERRAWEARLDELGTWLFEHLTERTPAYLNYYAANACAMALIGRRSANGAYLALAKRLAAHCLRHVSGNGLIFGEGSPTHAVSPKGCAAIDFGYNAEETLPCLTRYAQAAGDAETLERCVALWRAQLAWMLPDGGWDNSVGTRAFKWTYWGSRTADGCQAALFSLSDADPAFAQAAWRNFELLRACTQDGLLAGGPDYVRAGEPLCVHHTFCHAKVLAAALDAGIPAIPCAPLPSEPPPFTFYPELDVCRLAAGAWRMDVSGYDFRYPGASHATGGCVSLLWHADAGPLIAVGMVDYALREPHNQQLPQHSEAHRSLCPRLEATVQGRRYGQQYCTEARLSCLPMSGGAGARAETALCDETGAALPGGACTLEYRLSAAGLTVCGQVDPALAGSASFVLPLIGDRATVRIRTGTLQSAPAAIFNLSPGFCAKEYWIAPDLSGCVCFTINVEEKGARK
ncbi:MAG: hypothetical protein IKD72_00735 [Clostridia bacterium]|nr:hypothetical protein [Clostridia bacterium]